MFGIDALCTSVVTSDPSSMSLPLSESSFTSEDFTASSFSCLLPTLSLGSVAAA